MLRTQSEILDTTPSEGSPNRGLTSKQIFLAALSQLKESPNTQDYLIPACVCVKLAWLVYQTPTYATRKLKTWGISASRYVFFDRNDSQAIMIKLKDFIVVSFRGTEPDCVADWMTNTRIIRKVGPFQSKFPFVQTICYKIC